MEGWEVETAMQTVLRRRLARKEDPEQKPQRGAVVLLQERRYVSILSVIGMVHCRRGD